MSSHKLVRDRIPEMIKTAGQEPITKILLDDAEYLQSLERKLDEEVAEFHDSKELEELADILEVLYALAEAQGHSVDALLSAYQKKHDQRGGFSKRIFLISKKETNT